jgi:hypothetical protein
MIAVGHSYYRYSNVGFWKLKWTFFCTLGHKSGGRDMSLLRVKRGNLIGPTRLLHRHAAHNDKEEKLFV